ncbi:MAG: hypothetical protein M3O31_10780, partial [Acidobacteriota bacterium]|nr:hypothetical protein [Acidobacteriota bacterium]
MNQAPELFDGFDHRLHVVLSFEAFWGITSYRCLSVVDDRGLTAIDYKRTGRSADKCGLAPSTTHMHRLFRRKSMKMICHVQHLLDRIVVPVTGLH